jgi:outer membrane protein assembly factor BamD (BamD/ComL family)
MRFSSRVFYGLIATVALTGCFTSPVTIPADATVAEINQLGQSALEKDRYQRALQYYNAIKQRFPNDPSACAGADYSIAFVDYKRKRYDNASAGFKALLALYNKPSGEALPKKYKILSEIILQEISPSDTTPTQSQ